MSKKREEKRREYKQTVKTIISPRSITRLTAIVGAVLVAVFSLLSPLAANAVSYGGGSVSGYAADKQLDNGTIVQLNPKDSKQVQSATQSNMQNMFGVTVDRSQLLVSSSDDSLQNEAFVAVSGTYNVLVSTQGGTINSGDFVTLSAIDGVGMKADDSQSTVFGRAQGSFDGSGTVLGTSQIKDVNGAVVKTVQIGSIPVTIDIQHNPNIKTTKENLPQFLQKVGQAIAQKEVNPIRIYLSLGITAICIIAAIIVLYAGVRNSVISIGRNPMSKKSIFRALVEVILTALVILIIGLFAVYLLLKL
jgi:hypothetical protein